MDRFTVLSAARPVSNGAPEVRRATGRWVLSGRINADRYSSQTHTMRIVLTLTLAITGLPVFAGTCDNIGQELSAMVAVDQALREHLIREMPTTPTRTKPRIVEQMEVIDRGNTERLKSILDHCGWPTKSHHGDKAVNDAWLLTQHADQDPKFQDRAIRLLEAMVKLGEASGVQLAYLSDRVATAQGRAQLYGTQFDVVGECGLELKRVDSVEKVEERRKTLGMPSLAEYRQQVVRHAMPPQCSGGNAK